MHHAKYEMFGKVGKNNYSTVFDAHDLVLKRDVVIIELHERFRKDSNRWPLIWQQILTLSGGGLDNVVPVFEAIQEQGWIICEKMRGNLRETVETQALSPELVRSVMQQSLIALNCYHEKGIWHGDVKPANLLFNNEGRIRLSFSPGLVLGGQIPERQFDFKYLIPETLNPALGEIGPAADLYCLGFSALELLKGPQFAKLFRGVGVDAIDADGAWVQWHTSPEKVLPKLEELLPGVPLDVATTIERLIKKPVDERFASAQEALDSLDPKSTAVVLVPVKNETKLAPAVAKPIAATPAAKAKPAKRAPAAKPAKAATSSKGINDTLKKPWILYPVLACILLPLFWFLFLYDASPKQEATTSAVQTVATVEPKVESTTPILPPVITRKPVEALRPAREPVIAQRPEPEPEPVLPPLPDGLVAAEGAELHPTLQLPLRAVSNKLTDAVPPLEFVLFEPLEYEYGVVEPSMYGEIASRTETIPQAYYIAKYETTNGQFAQFAKEHGISPDGSDDASGSSDDAAAQELPVVSISIERARLFCEWLSKNGRLPTEVEWEYAARLSGVDGNGWSNESATPDRVNADTRDDGKLPSEREAVSVNAMSEGDAPNRLPHILGNVSEWCEAKFSEGYGVDRKADPGIEVNYVARGGSFVSDIETVRPSLREAVPPEGDRFVGFRVVIAVDAPTASP